MSSDRIAPEKSALPSISTVGTPETWSFLARSNSSPHGRDPRPRRTCPSMSPIEPDRSSDVDQDVRVTDISSVVEIRSEQSFYGCILLAFAASKPNQPVGIDRVRRALHQLMTKD